MGFLAISQEPRTEGAVNPSELCPCLVHVRTETAVDLMWGNNITHIPLQKGFVCLVSIDDLDIQVDWPRCSVKYEEAPACLKGCLES